MGRIVSHPLWKKFDFFKEKNPCHPKIPLLFYNACIGSGMAILFIKINSTILLPLPPTTLVVLKHFCWSLHELGFCFSCEIDFL